MASRIEQLIEELADYIDGCKFQPLSNTKIVVVKEEIDALIDDLRRKTPEELSKYQKVVSNQQEILNDARRKAEKLISEATAQTTEMVNQNSIMRQAYAQADEVVKAAYRQANEMIENARAEADALRTAAVDYMDNMLADYETLVGNTMRLTQGHYESFYTQLNQYMDVVVSNRMELKPPMIDTADIPYIEDETGNISVPDQTAAMNTQAMSNTAKLNNTQAMSGTTQIGNTASLGNTGSMKAAANAKAPGTNTADIKLDLL